MTAPRTESKAAFARRLGVHRSYVTRAAQAGQLVLEGDLVVIADSIVRLKATKGGRADVAARHAAQRGSPMPEHVRDNKADHSDDLPAASRGEADDKGRAHYRAIVLHLENQQIKLGMAIARGIRFQRRDVGHEAASLGGLVRSAIERVIDQTAPRLAAVPDQADRRRLLTAEVKAVRRTVRAELAHALRRLRRANSKGAQT